MKTLNTLFLLSMLIGVLGTSCKRLIEIPGNPPGKISQTQQFADSSTAMGAIASVYSYTPPSFFFSTFGASIPSGFGFDNGFFTVATSLSSDELSTTNTGDPYLGQFYSYSLEETNKDVNALWSTAYTKIYTINSIMESVQASKGLSTSFVKQVMAEMKVVRSFYYFNLVNLFGGVPLVTSSDYKQNMRLSRSSVEEVYQQIGSDLADAVRDLDVNYPSASKARPNKFTALTLLAKVNLYRGNWAAAYNEADSIIKLGSYKLSDDLSQVFLEGSTEAIWQLPLLGPTNGAAEAVLFTPTSATSAPVYLLSHSLLDAFDEDDARRQWITKVNVNVGGSVSDFYYASKYKNVKLANNNPKEAYMIFRLAEVILMHAEAAAHLPGKLDVAIADLDSIRLRAGLKESTATGQQGVLDAIINERQKELFCEWGNRWFDLKRLDKADAILSEVKTGWNTNAKLYPIPYAQRQLNDLLTKNPGY